MSSLQDFTANNQARPGIDFGAEDAGISLEISDERMRELVADVMKDGPCKIPGCAVCSGEMWRRGQ